MQCTLCSRAIEGSYIHYKKSGWNVCSSCQRLPVCSKCGLPVVGMQSKEQGRVFHESCYTKLKNCALCKSKLLGKYVVYSNQTMVCANCLDDWKSCEICGIPVHGRRNQKGTTAHHPQCLNRALKCVLCKSLIDGPYYLEHKKIFDEERVICRSCYQRTPTCDFCFRKIEGSTHDYANGLYSCQGCFAQAVTSEQALPAIKVEAIQWLEAFYPQMGLREIPVQMGLIPTSKLSSLLRNKGRKTRLNGVYLYKSKRTASRVIEESHTIFLEEGLPWKSCLGVLIHELTHLWQNVTLGKMRDLEEIEGHATWVEFRFLEDIEHKIQANRLFYRQDYPYGTGLRRFLELEKRLKSPAAVFESMKLRSSLGSKLQENPRGSFSVKA